MEDGKVLPIQKKKGIVLAIISGRGLCPVEMTVNLAMQSWPPNTNFEIATVYGAETGEGRNSIAKISRERGMKRIWFVDDDTVPPPDTGRQLSHVMDMTGAKVVAGVYTTRSSPPEPLVFTEQGAGPSYDWKVGEKKKIWGAGTGCMMVELDIFDHLPEPWFKTVDEAADRWTDDLYFCELVNQAGFDVWLHGGILCHHYDFEKGMIYQLPRNCAPYRDRINEPLEPRLTNAATAPSGQAADLMFNPWMTATETLWLIRRAQESATFVELGCWRCVTTRNIAKNSKAIIYAIDHFAGSAEHLDPKSPNYEPRLKDDPRWLFKEALKNTKDLDNVRLLEGRSAEVAAGFNGTQFDTVFIDASHDYENVKRDINTWLPKVAHKGVICGHDFNWPGVERAVKELLPGAFNIPGTSIWTYTKGV